MSEGKWYALVDGDKFGPVDEATLFAWIGEQRITPETLVWRTGMQSWMPALAVAGAPEALRAAGYKVDLDARDTDDETRIAMSTLPEPSEEINEVTLSRAPPVQPSRVDIEVLGDAEGFEDTYEEQPSASPELKAQARNIAVNLQAQSDVDPTGKWQESDEGATRQLQAELMAHAAPGGLRDVHTAHGHGSGTFPEVNFSGRGGRLALVLLPGLILSVATLGIYGFWLVRDLIGWVTGHVQIRGQHSRFEARVSDIAGHILKNGLLCVFTLGIYSPWALADSLQWLCTRTHCGNLEPRSTNTGGELLGVMLTIFLLQVVTLGIYTPWGMRRLYAHCSERIQLGGERLQYNGRGIDLLWLGLSNALLVMLTVGIYTPWAMCRTKRYHCSSTSLTPARG